MVFEDAWDSITKIEIEVDSYEELIQKSDLPPFPMDNVGGGITPEQMEWMATYGQRIDPAMPQRAMQHYGGPFVAPRSKAVFVNPANPNKVFKVNAGATLPIAFSHALNAMGYPVAPMTPLARFETPNEYEDDASTSVIGQDRLDVVPNIGYGQRKEWPEHGEHYFDNYTWMDMFRDNIADRKFAGKDIPASSSPDWIKDEGMTGMDAWRGMEFLERQGVDANEWIQQFFENMKDERFKPRYEKDTPRNRLVNAINQELDKYRQLEIQPGYERYERDGKISRDSNIGGNRWEDPLLRFLQLDQYSSLGPNVGLDENGRPMLTSFSIKGSPTMRLGMSGVGGRVRPMLMPRKVKGKEDNWDRAARRTFGMPNRATTVKFEKDPVYGILRPVYGTAYRPQTLGGYTGALNAETGERIDWPMSMPRGRWEDIFEENPEYLELYGMSPEGVNLADELDFSYMIQGFPVYGNEEEGFRYDAYGEKNPLTQEIRARLDKPFADYKMVYDRPKPENYKYQTEAERDADPDANSWDDTYEKELARWHKYYTGGREPTPEEIEEARQRYASIDTSWTFGENRRRPHTVFDLRDQLRGSPLMRYLAMNPGVEAIMPVDRIRGFNTPGNDDEASGLFPNPMPQYFDPNQDVYRMGRDYDGQAFGGVKVPFNDGSGREFPINFRIKPDAGQRRSDRIEPQGKKVYDAGTEEWEYQDPFDEAWRDSFGRGDVKPKKFVSGPRWVDPQMENPNTDFIQTIGAIHDSYPLPESSRLAELLANMPDRSIFDANPAQQAYYDKFMKVFPKDIAFWQGMADDPLMSNEKAFELYSRLRDSYDD
jgi:hypothetical protein